jgi:hypothetical protein
MAFYDEMAAMATELLAPEADGGFGKTTAFIRTTAITSQPAAGTVTQGVPVDTAINAVQVDHDEKYTPGALIENGDLFWVLDGRANIEDELYVNSQLYNVVEVWPIVPGDTFVACRAQTRGGVKVAATPASDLAILDSDGNTFNVSFSVLDSDGNAFTVTDSVLDSDGNAFTVI